MDPEPIAVRLAVTRAMARELNGYLRGGKLHFELRVDAPGGSLPVVMTLGALLENLAALRREQGALTPVQLEELQDALRDVERDRRLLAGPWRSILRRELKALVNAWRWYVDELEAQQPRARENYAGEVRKRLRIALLLEELGQSPDLTGDREKLAVDDARLRQRFRDGDYVGPGGANQAYRPERAWWLYGSPV